MASYNESNQGRKKAGGKLTMITVRERGRRSKKCMAKGKKELIDLLSSENSPIHSLGFI